jgi:hypothetical protein
MVAIFMGGSVKSRRANFNLQLRGSTLFSVSGSANDW